MRVPSVSAAISLVLLEGCAAVNPNPNTGMRAADLAYSSGDCEGARKIAEPAALRGEPWAQYRMGILLVDEKCPNTSQKTALAGLDWLAKAACYESKSAWERGSELGVGPVGYFNTRASSTKAALKLDDIFIHLQKRIGASWANGSWAWINHARSQYNIEEDGYKELSQRLAEIESLIGQERVAIVKTEKPICSTQKSVTQPNVSSDAAQ